MAVLTKDRSGLARSGATRSGYPILIGVRVPKYALAGVARSGASRANYTSPAVCVSIAGVHYATGRPVDSQKILDGSLTIAETNNAPNTAALTTKGFTPSVGQDVVITLGSKNNLKRLFAGTILTDTRSYVDTPANFEDDLSVIDYTWGMLALKVTGHWWNTSATVIATALIAQVPGYTANGVDANLPVIDEISITDQDLPSALSQLVKLAGLGGWRCDFYKDIKLWLTADSSETPPTALNAVHPSLTAFTAMWDVSQTATRCRVQGGGTAALEALVAGQTILPVVNAVWYPLPGVVASGKYHVTTGVVIVGQNRLTYTGVVLGGPGTLVGTGAAPAAASAAALASGAGMETGAHTYAVTFATAAGESIAGPSVPITVGVTAAPASAPTTAAATIGTGPDAGSHDYAVTFVTASGETTPGPRVTQATGLTAAPTVSPTPGTPRFGAGADAGNHDYAVSFVTSIGETTASPISAQVTTSTVPTPTVAPGVSALAFAIGQDANWAIGDTVVVAVSYSLDPVAGNTVLNETDRGPTASIVLTANRAFPSDFNDLGVDLPMSTNPFVKVFHGWIRNVTKAGAWRLFINGTHPNNPAGGVWYGNDVFGGALLTPTLTPNAAVQAVPLTAIPLGDAHVTGRQLYRRSGGLGLKLLATIADNTTTTYTDTTANASLGVAPLSTSTAYLQRIALANIPLGGALVTQRTVYRTAAGGSTLLLLTTLADNTTTVFADTVTDASLGAAAPGSNTATAYQVAISAIPIGAASVTSRKLYRTVAGGSQLKLLHTIADNVTAVWTDSAADATLGANVPTSDTSGLTQPLGNVLAGSTSLQCAGVTAFDPTGGWAVIGNGTQVIRYTGIAGNTLTGIPAAGVGAIVASITFGSTATAAAYLTGIPASGAGSVLYPILKGDPVYFEVTVDDLAAQAVLAALIGGTGIREASLTDNQIASPEAIAQGKATLALESAVLLTVPSFTTRDINLAAGRLQALLLGPPFNLATSLLVQTVAVSGFAPAICPTCVGSCAATRFTFDELLRLMVTG